MAPAVARPRRGAEIRAAFLEFYESRGHKPIPSASLIPEDPTVLLTIAGMLPFKPVFLGQQERPAPRATSSQKCIRTNDIENVGRTARHHTFFEMLGNFSFGDYFKQQAIEWAWELSTGVFGLDPKNLVVSVFREDDEAEAIWRDVVGVNPKRIIRMDEADNFWASGPTGLAVPAPRSITTSSLNWAMRASIWKTTAASSSSTTWCSCNTAVMRKARSRRWPTRTSIPVWASSGWPRSCRGCPTTTKPI